MSANDPVYPIRGFTADASGALCGEYVSHVGLTKREHFSLEMAKAHRIAHPNASPPELANMGVVDADALLDLLAQLSKEPT